LRVVRVRVGKGRTSRPGEAEEWVREYYELEVELGEGEDAGLARDWALSQIDQWLTQPSAPEWIPKLDIADVDGLVWTSYKTKERAKPGEAAWTFSDPERHDDPEKRRTVRELSRAIQTCGGRLELGDMIYSFSGSENQFISRRPSPKKK